MHPSGCAICPDLGTTTRNRPTCRCAWRNGCSPPSPAGSATGTSIRRPSGFSTPTLAGCSTSAGDVRRSGTPPCRPAYKVLLRAGLVLKVLAAPWLIVPEDGLWSLPAVLLVCLFLFGVE